MFMDVGQSRCELGWTSVGFATQNLFLFFWIHILIFLWGHCPLPSQALRVGSWFRPVWSLCSLSHRGYFKDEHMTQPKLMRFADENILERDIISFLLILDMKRCRSWSCCSHLAAMRTKHVREGTPCGNDRSLCECVHVWMSFAPQFELPKTVYPGVFGSVSQWIPFFLQHIQPNKCLKCVH